MVTKKILKTKSVSLVIYYILYRLVTKKKGGGRDILTHLVSIFALLVAGITVVTISTVGPGLDPLGVGRAPWSDMAGTPIDYPYISDTIAPRPRCSDPPEGSYRGWFKKITLVGQGRVMVWTVSMMAVVTVVAVMTLERRGPPWGSTPMHLLVDLLLYLLHLMHLVHF